MSYSNSAYLDQFRPLPPRRVRGRLRRLHEAEKWRSRIRNYRRGRDVKLYDRAFNAAMSKPLVLERPGSSD